MNMYQLTDGDPYGEFFVLARNEKQARIVANAHTCCSLQRYAVKLYAVGVKHEPFQRVLRNISEEVIALSNARWNKIEGKVQR